MNDDSPVRAATTTSQRRNDGCASPAGAASRTSGAPTLPLAHDHAARATATFMTPAVSSVPGSPSAGMSTNPESSTPAAAPRLLRK